MIGGIIPNPIDLRFQKVSGLSTEVQLETINEGGDNTHMLRVPKTKNYGNLVLERGYLPTTLELGFGNISPLNLEFMDALDTLQFTPSDVLITLFSESGFPVGGWLFRKAYPVKWSVSDLDAQSNSVLIDTMELAYSSFSMIRM
jgi:phage tail-like protein